MRVCGMVASVVLPFVLLLAAGCSKPEEPKQAAPPAPAAELAEGKALFEKKCRVCHGLDRTTARKESREKWMEIVKSMQGKKADFISDAEAVKIVEFLAGNHGTK